MLNKWRHMTDWVRYLVTSTLILLGVLTSMGRALAADYGVDFAVRTDNGNDR